MDRHAVLQKNNSQNPVFKLSNPRPPPYSTIGLDFFSDRTVDHKSEPFIPNHDTIWPRAGRKEIGCEPKSVHLALPHCYVGGYRSLAAITPSSGLLAVA